MEARDFTKWIFFNKNVPKSQYTNKDKLRQRDTEQIKNWQYMRQITFKNIGIEADDTCRHCNEHKETVEHQLIDCKWFDNTLRKYRNKYSEMKIDDFNDAIFIQDEFMGETS